MSKKELKSISNRIMDTDLDLVFLDLHTQSFQF